MSACGKTEKMSANTKLTRNSTVTSVLVNWFLSPFVFAYCGIYTEFTANPIINSKISGTVRARINASETIPAPNDAASTASRRKPKKRRSKCAMKTVNEARRKVGFTLLYHQVEDDIYAFNVQINRNVCFTIFLPLL